MSELAKRAIEQILQPRLVTNADLARDLGGVVELVLGPEHGTWRLNLSEPETCLGTAAPEAKTIRLTMSFQTLEGLLSGRLDHRLAIAQGDVQVESAEEFSGQHLIQVLGFDKSAAEHDVRYFDLLEMLGPTDAISFATPWQIARLLFFHQQLLAVADIPGDVWEFGVWRGLSTCMFDDLIRILDGSMSNRNILAFDTFSGFPGGQMKKLATMDAKMRGHFRDTSRALVERKLAYRPDSRVRLCEGDVYKVLPRTIETWPNKIAIALCDLDEGEVTRFVLEQIWDRMSPGGRIIFDEYSLGGWSETTGVDAFLRSRGLSLSLVKRAGAVMTPTAYLVVPG